MSEPRMTLDYEPPKRTSRGKVLLIAGIFFAAGLVFGAFLILDVRMTRMSPPTYLPKAPPYAPRSVTPVIPATAPATRPSN